MKRMTMEDLTGDRAILKQSLMTKSFQFLIPIMPNFIKFKKEPSSRQEGINFEQGFPISELSKSEAEEYGELMKIEFIKHWEHKKTINKKIKL